jgi:hypothetical protein
MSITNARLSLVTFPQRWDGARIAYRVLVLPKGDPRAPLVPGQPAFANATLQLRARIISGLDQMPAAADALPAGTQVVQTPAGVAGVFDELAGKFTIDLTQTGNPQPAVTFKKYLTRSYRGAFAFEGPSRPYLYTGDTYECALKAPTVSTRGPGPWVPKPLGWGQLLTFAIRQPLVAKALGVLFEGQVTVPDDAFENGGWLYVDLAPASAFASVAAANVESVAMFAARIPPLTTARPLFASVVFPVGATGPFDEQILEAESYDDGFAKIVHGGQPETGAMVETEQRAAPVIKDLGVRLGWDDEQIAIWLNRQTDATTSTPMGVAGYRVDVRRPNTGQWISLTRATGRVIVDSLNLGTFDDELVVEVAPQQIASADYWLPSYFATWRGSSIVLRTDNALRLAKRDSVVNNRPFSVPNADDIPDLRYGEAYEFRVRLVDLSRGGPVADDDAFNPAPASSTTIQFRRYSPPKAVWLEAHPDQEEDEPLSLLRVRRPLIGYPDAVFADVPNAEMLLLADLASAGAAEREAGLPDPDVAHVEITIEVRRPDVFGGNTVDAAFQPVYTTTRAFPTDVNDPLDLTIDYVDRSTLETLETDDPLAPEAGTGAIEVPTAREVRLRMTTVCKPDPSLTYFGTQAARRSAVPYYVTVRAPSSDERNLVRPDSPGQQCRALMLRPDPAPRANQAATRVAERLGLNVSNLTFTGDRGRRTVFGCSGALRHTLSPDRSAISFAAASELTGQWIVALRLTLERDWTWDALALEGFEVMRDGVRIGAIDAPGVVSRLAVGGDRKETDLVFFHAIDPKPRPGAFPAEIQAAFTVRPTFRDAPAFQDAPLQWSLRLPVATPPTQTPRLVSAGIALSPYEVLPEYASTNTRERMLWFELDGPPLDPQDRYMARVVAYAPDPVLLPDGAEIPLPSEPPLPIEEELVRVIVPGQPRDNAGANAMHPLMTAPGRTERGGTMFLVARPEGLDASSPDLFGFFVYELRVAHDNERWSLEQARFGAPLRVAGVQHPAPPLTCHVSRTKDAIHVDAPYATPVLDGRNLRPRVPNTEIWVLLYVQANQADGAGRRNVLLMRGRGYPLKSTTGSDQLYGDDFLLFAAVRFPQDQVRALLTQLGLPISASLSVLAVELLPQPDQAGPRYPDPLGGDLGQVRILRASPLAPVPLIC